MAHAAIGTRSKEREGLNRIIMQPGESTKLERDCEVVQIPEGLRVRLARGTQVRLLQNLGGTFSLITEYGTMVRLDGHDGDAIGEKPVVVTQTASDEPVTPDQLKSKVWEALRTVYDPEIPINVVELGLVYKNEVSPVSDNRYRVDVDMTLTAPGCGMGPVLQQDALRKIQSLPGVQEANVQIVIEPQWTQDMMSEVAKLELGLA
jgi:probable FeS assembly SUF system protein SufT